MPRTPIDMRQMIICDGIKPGLEVPGVDQPSLWFDDGQVKVQQNLSLWSGQLTVRDDLLLRLGNDGDQALVNRSTALNANTALTGVLAGTPVVTAIPANSLVISNVTANGDIVLATLLGGTNSQEAFRIDTSAGLMVFNEGSADWDFRVETDGLAFAIYADGGKNALVLGSNTDTSSADQLITVSRAARTATTTVNYFDLVLSPAGAVTIPTGATAIVATVSLAEPNITLTGTVTRAATLYIASQPTEGGTANAAILFGAAANIACTTSLTFNEDSEDIDFRFEGANNTNMLVLDGGSDSGALGRAVVAGAFLSVDGSAVNRDGVTAVGRHIHIPAATITQTNANPTTLAIAAGVYVGIPTLAGANAGQTIDAAASVYIAGAAAQGSNVTLTSPYALWVDAGATRLDGNLDMSDSGLDIVVKAATAAAIEISDGTTKFYAIDTRVATAGVTSHTFNISAYTFASAATNVATALSVPAHTLNYTGTTQVTSEVVSVSLGARTIAGDTATLTVDKASTLNLQAPIEGTNITLTAASALRIVTTTGSPTTQYGIFIESLTGGGTNRGIYLAGANGIEFAAADDIVILANTAAALEVSDGTTKLLTFDTRNTVTVQNLLIDAPASQTLPDGATSQFRNVSVAAHTVTLAGTTQVTTVNQGAQLFIGAPTYNQSGGAVTVDQVSTVHIVAPVAGASVTITANRMISTSVSDCYLTAAGVWTDTVCTEKVKSDIEGLDYQQMPGLLEMIRPVSFKYDAKKLQANDFGRERYGVVAEELPEFLRVPGEVNPSGMSGTVLAAFGLAAVRYLHEENKALKMRLAELELRVQ